MYFCHTFVSVREGSSATTSFEHNYGGDEAPPVGYIYFYRVSALDDCPNESALSAPAGAECAFDGQVQITPAAGTVIYGVRDIVVTAYDAHKLGRRVRYRAGIKQGVGPIRIGSVIGRLIRAVRIHMKQNPRAKMRDIRILPA